MASQRSRQRRPKERASGPSAGVIIEQPPLWGQHTRIGGSLTPDIVSTILTEADFGDISRLCDLFNECRQKDATLHANLFTRESAVASLEWQLRYRDKTRKKLTENQLSRLDSVIRKTNCVDDTLQHLVGAIGPGFAVCELVAGDVDGMLVPVRVIPHAARRFRYRQSDGRLVWCDSTTNFIEIDFQTRWPEKFVVIHRRINGDVQAREGLMRLLVWFALFRQWDLGDWLKLAELAWKPLRIGRYDRKNGKNDINILRDVLSSLTSNGAAYLPKDIDLELVWAGGGKVAGQEGHQNLYDAMGREIAKAVNGQTLTGDHGSVGSQALGKVHESIFGRIVEADACANGRCLEEQLVARVVRWNFGPEKTAPMFDFSTDESIDIAEFADAVGKLAKAGLKIPAEWVRDQVGMPEAVDGDELIDGSKMGDEPDDAEVADKVEPEDDKADIGSGEESQ